MGTVAGRPGCCRGDRLNHEGLDSRWKSPTVADTAFLYAKCKYAGLSEGDCLDYARLRDWSDLDGPLGTLGVAPVAGVLCGFGCAALVPGLADKPREQLGALATGAQQGFVGTARQTVVTFGHGARHLLEAPNLPSREVVETAITSHVQRIAAGAQSTGEFWGRVVVNGVTIEYRAFTLPDGVINVGTHIVK